MKVELSKTTRKWLISLVNAIDEEIQLREEDKVLIIMQLNTEEKIDMFSDWIKTKIVDEKLVASSIDIMNATARIGRLKCGE